MASSIPAIHDRASFAAALDAADAQTLRLLDTSSDRALLQGIADQLARMQAHVVGRPRLADEDVATIDVGPIAARNFDDSQRDYANLLMDLNYAFRRYPALAASDPSLARPRRGILQAISGKDTFRKHILQRGDRIVVGRGAHSDFVLADTTIAPRHLEIGWDGIVAPLRTLGAGTRFTLNGAALLCGELRHGDVLNVGDSVLRFFVEQHSGSSDAKDTVSATDIDEPLRQLDEAFQQGHLYAVVDAARDRAALPLLEEAVDDHASLYEGQPARALDGEAPYLVHFSPTSALLQRLLQRGWTQAWGIFLRSTATPKLVRRNLRRLLMVEAEGEPQRLYFRFYDPRVMRSFWPLATPRQRSQMLESIDAYYFEESDGQLHVASQYGTNNEEAPS